MKPHKHAELIKAWVEGAEIQVHTVSINPETNVRTPIWVDISIHDVINGGDWDGSEYRIKPEPKPEVIKYASVKINFNGNYAFADKDNIKLVFDGETGELKSAEVLK